MLEILTFNAVLCSSEKRRHCRSLENDFPKAVVQQPIENMKEKFPMFRSWIPLPSTTHNNKEWKLEFKMWAVPFYAPQYLELLLPYRDDDVALRKGKLKLGRKHHEDFSLHL